MDFKAHGPSFSLNTESGWVDKPEITLEKAVCGFKHMFGIVRGCLAR